jgi:hypothetical protein
MDTTINRVLLVYRMLGQILDAPQSFGLGDRAPKPLIDVLTAMRQDLREELAEENRLSAEDWLSGELSQDSDSPTTLAARWAGGAARFRSGG